MARSIQEPLVHAHYYSIKDRTHSATACSADIESQPPQDEGLINCVDCLNLLRERLLTMSSMRHRSVLVEKVFW